MSFAPLYRGRLFAAALAVTYAFAAAAQPDAPPPEATPAPATPPPWAEPFAADTAAIAAAAAELEPAVEGGRVLLEEIVVRYEEDGRQEARRREVVRIDSQAAVSSWNDLSAQWRPWHQERPELRVRVIAADGTVRTLDPATVAEVPVEEQGVRVISDARRLRAPAPGLAVGTVLESEVTLRDTEPLFEAGVVGRMVIGYGVPVEASRLVLDAPASLPLTWRAWKVANPEPRREEADGRVRLVFDLGPSEPRSELEAWTPGDVRQRPTVAWATGRSWQEVAAAYAGVVERQLDGVDVAEVAAAATRGVDGRAARVAALVAELHRRVRYTGLEFGEAAIVPRPPAETLTRGYGDCKDKSALLVALLQEAGVDAHLALLDAGYGEDVHPELPGFGAFNHAVVHVPAAGDEPAIWIDATAEWYPVGLVPSSVQGRLALLATRRDGRLVEVPRAASADRVHRAEREIRFAEDGFGDVVERIEYHGLAAADTRGFFQSISEDARRESVERYVESNWHRDEVADWSLAALAETERPLSFDVEIEEAPPVITSFTESVALLDVGSVLGDLPNTLSADPEEAEPREHDLVITEPYRREVRYRLVPANGFVPADVPEDEEWELGPARLTRTSEIGDDGVVTIDVAFDSGPAVYSVEDVEETRAALADLDTSLHVYFDNLGSRLLAEGDVAGALAETRRAAAASDHPLHDARLSNVLLTAGLRDAARRVAEAAVAEAPDSAVAHRTLGFVLMHDPAGRRFGVGWERDDAIASLRRATELDPEDTLARHNLAVVLARGDDGELYADGCDLEAAIGEYATLEEADYHETDADYLSALFEAGRYAEVAERAEEMAASPTLRVFQVAAVAQRRGATPALRLVRDLDDSERRSVVALASNKLLVSRNYRPAAELFERLQRGAPNAAQIGALVDLLRVVGNAEEVTIEGDGPKAVVLRYNQLLARRDLAGLRRQFSWRGEEFADARIGEIEITLDSGEGRKLARLSSDLVTTALQIEPEGSDEWGYRVKIESSISPADVVYLAPGEDGLRLVGMVGGGTTMEHHWLPGFGRVALDLLRAGELEGARRWLDWAREEVPLFDSEEPLAVSPFARLWQLGAEAGEAEARRAAAVLMVDGVPAERDEALALLEAARRASDDAEVTRHLELALVEPYLEEERWDDLLATTASLSEFYADSLRALLLRAKALEELGRRDEVIALGQARFEADPDDEAAQSILAYADRHAGDLASAARRIRRISEMPDGDWADNDVAWFEVVLGEADEATVESARRAAEGGGRAELHTLATVYADLERPAAARDVLHQMLNLDHEGLQPHDWYVVGRIAESYGERELAKGCYQRVEPPEEPEEGAPVSTHFLAQRRLAALARPEAEGGG